MDAQAPTRAPARGSCWATLLTDAKYLPCLLVLAYSLQASHTRYPLVVMVTEALSARARDVVRRAGCVVQDVPYWALSKSATMAEARFEHTWTKLRALELYDYERVVLVDCDMLVTRNMDELHTLALPPQTLAAGLACTCNPNRVATYPADWIPAHCGFSLRPHPPTVAARVLPTHGRLNSGLVVLRPDPAQTQALVDYVDTHREQIEEYRFPDQDLLADVFAGRWVCLPWYYNALKTLRRCHADLWADSEVRNVHYILEYVKMRSRRKPWHIGPPGQDTTPDAALHALWWDRYRELAADPAKLGLTSVIWATDVAVHVHDTQ